MKRITAIFSLLVLCCVSAFAQNRMDRTTFEHLVDYANCQYLMAFIEQKDADKPYIKDVYEKNVKPILQTASLENLSNVPGYSKIKSLFPKGSNDLASELADKINARKDKYDRLSNDNSLIESLRTTGWKNIPLKGVATQVVDHINTKLNTVSTQNLAPGSEQVNVQNQPGQTSSQDGRSQTDTALLQYDSLQDEISTLWVLVIICLVVIALLIVVLYWWYKIQFDPANPNSSVRKFVKSVFFNSDEIKNKFAAIPAEIKADSYNNDISMFEERLQKLEQGFDRLQSIINSTKAGENKNPVNLPIIQTTTKFLNPSVLKVNEFYFASKSEKQLMEQVPNPANASFKVFEIIEHEAKFEYIGPVRNENWFEGVCLIENSESDNLSNKKHIKSTQPGKVRKENDNWYVIVPAKIRFM